MLIVINYVLNLINLKKKKMCCVVHIYFLQLFEKEEIKIIKVSVER